VIDWGIRPRSRAGRCRHRQALVRLRSTLSPVRRRAARHAPGGRSAVGMSPRSRCASNEAPGKCIEGRETDCVAGVVGLELRNVVANYPFVFRGIKPNSGHRDYSRLSCGVGETQLGRTGGDSQQGVCADARSSRRIAGLFPPRERVWWSRPASLTACSSLPRQRPSASAGLRRKLRNGVAQLAAAGSSLDRQTFLQCRRC
jgi:hypothetical protein